MREWIVILCMSKISKNCPRRIEWKGNILRAFNERLFVFIFSLCACLNVIDACKTIAVSQVTDWH
jgi:hypothetical protein